MNINLMSEVKTYQSSHDSCVPTDCLSTNNVSFVRLTTVFVGGIQAHIKQEDLRQHFQKYGEIANIKLSINPKTNCNKGYSFLTFKDPKSVKQVIEEHQIICGRKVDCKISLGGKHNKEDKIKASKAKIFVKKLHKSVKDQELMEYFQQFGQIKNAYCIYDPETKVTKGFGYIQFENESSVATTLSKSHFFRGKRCILERYSWNAKKDKKKSQKSDL